MPKSEQGADPQRFQVIPRTLIFLFHQGKVLLIKGAANKKIWANRYNGLGGHIEAGEDILSAARRELFEESGIVCPINFCGTVMCDVEPALGILLFVYRGTVNQPVFKPSEEGQLEWVPIADIDRLPVVEDLPAMLARVYSWTPTDGVFSAANRYNEAGKLETTFYD